MEKSELISTQKLVFLGMELDTENGIIRPTQHTQNRQPSKNDTIFF